MPRHAHSQPNTLWRSGQLLVRSSQIRRPPRPAAKLGPSNRLIAPAHPLTLPSLEGVRSEFEVSYDTGDAVAPARALIERGWMTEKHLFSARSVVEALGSALTDIVEQARPPESGEDFGIQIQVADRLDGHREQENVLFFVWENTSGTDYIPLRPFFERLEAHPCRERLMASLYQWLYRASRKVVPTFGFEEAKDLYDRRLFVYKEAREAGEDVDLEGEVEAANPATVVAYIRHSQGLRLKEAEVAPALESIGDPELRAAFEKAHKLFLDTRSIRLPKMSPECATVQWRAERYAEADPTPGLGLSHCRDDAIVAWLDEYNNDLFQSGVSQRPMLLHCFRPNDTKQFIQIIAVLPRMIRAVFALREWVDLAREIEGAAGNEWGDHRP